MDETKVGELFAGIAGFRLGLEKAGGYRTVWANDSDKYACQVYRRHYGSGELIEGDIRDVVAKDIPSIDLLTAGFPCQTHSIAGERKGIDESRGTLFAQIVRVASAKRPKFLLLENVRGLLSSSDDRAFALILRTLGSLGYILQWEVLNSKCFGVAQTRGRVFIIGCLGRECFKEIFPLKEDAGSLGTSFAKAEGKGIWFRGENNQDSIAIANTLSARYYKDGSENLIQLVQLNDDGGSQINRIYSPEGLSPTLPTACGGGHIPKIATLVDNGEGIRKLTPLECERIQSFPDGWTATGLAPDGKEIPLSDAQRYKLLGNAITVNVVEYIGRLLK